MQRRRLLKTLGLASATRLAPGLQALAAPAPDTPDIFFNQVGYRPGDTKVATVRGAAPGQSAFRLRHAPDNKVVFEAPLLPPALDPASGDRVQLADFSAWRSPGLYRLEFGGQGSGPFLIAAEVYAEALRTALRGYTGQRCGCAVDLGGGYAHPACHAAGGYGVSSGRSGSLPNHGGWHDAGDYGRYVVNSGITCGTLLWSWERYPDALRSLHLGLPHHGGDLPDFLEEVLWNLRWMQQMQEPDGGVFHKQTSDQFCAFIMPEADGLPSHVIGTGKAPYKSTAATADFAAVMAIAARCYGPFDRALAADFLAAARRGWSWAMANPAVPFTNPPGIRTGEYGDPHVGDELLWASAELWRTTGEPAFEEAFLRNLPGGEGGLRIDAPSWGNVGPMACWTYALASAPDTGPDAPPGRATARLSIREKTAAAARLLVERSRHNGYGNTLAAEDYVWGSNSNALNQSLLLAVAHSFEPGRDKLDAALANLHYVLGRNCFGVSWVTQVGTRPFQHPHHRPSAADGIADPWPGLLSGGPNARGGDKVADALPRRPPMRMWVDDQAAYSLNEIAINWNAPLVFTLAWANDRHSAS